MAKVNQVLVYLDEDAIDYRDGGLVTIAYVQYLDENGNEIKENDYEKTEITLNPGDMVNAEYHTVTEMEEAIAERLGISPKQVEIAG